MAKKSEPWPGLTFGNIAKNGSKAIANSNFLGENQKLEFTFGAELPIHLSRGLARFRKSIYALAITHQTPMPDEF